MATEVDDSRTTRKRGTSRLGTSFVLNGDILTYWITSKLEPFPAEVSFVGLLLQPIYFIIATVCARKYRQGLASGPA